MPVSLRRHMIIVTVWGPSFRSNSTDWWFVVRISVQLAAVLVCCLVP